LLSHLIGDTLNILFETLYNYAVKQYVRDLHETKCRVFLFMGHTIHCNVTWLHYVVGLIERAWWRWCRWWSRVDGCTWTAVRRTARPVSLLSPSTVVTRDSRSSKSGRRTFQSTSFSQIQCWNRSRAGRFQHVPSPGNGIHGTDLVNMAPLSEWVCLEICHMYTGVFLYTPCIKNRTRCYFIVYLWSGNDELHENCTGSVARSEYGINVYGFSAIICWYCHNTK